MSALIAVRYVKNQLYQRWRLRRWCQRSVEVVWHVQVMIKQAPVHYTCSLSGFLLIVVSDNDPCRGVLATVIGRQPCSGNRICSRGRFACV
jgi:hypothetical protein